MLTVYVSQTQTTTENIRDFQSTSYDIASGETKGFCSSGLKCLFLRLTHVFIFHIFSSHLHLFSLQSVPSCLDSTTLYRVRVRAHTHTTHSPTHSLTHTHTHTRTDTDTDTDTHTHAHTHTHTHTHKSLYALYIRNLCSLTHARG